MNTEGAELIPLSREKRFPNSRTLLLFERDFGSRLTISTVSKNVSRSVVEVLGLAVTVLTCVVRKIWQILSRNDA